MSFRRFVCLSFNQMKGLFGLSLRDGDMLLGFFYFKSMFLQLLFFVYLIDRLSYVKKVA